MFYKDKWFNIQHIWFEINSTLLNNDTKNKQIKAKTL